MLHNQIDDPTVNFHAISQTVQTVPTALFAKLQTQSPQRYPFWTLPPWKKCSCKTFSSSKYFRLFSWFLLGEWASQSANQDEAKYVVDDYSLDCP